MKVADDLSALTSEERAEQNKISKLWDISALVWNAAYTAKELHMNQMYHFDEEKEQTIYDIAVFMHTEVLPIMNHLISHLQDSSTRYHSKRNPSDKTRLRRRMSFIWKDVQTLPTPTVEESETETPSTITSHEHETKECHTSCQDKRTKRKRSWTEEKRESE